MSFFRNIIVAFILVGLLTRILNYLFQKKMKMKPISAAYTTFALVMMLFLPFISWVLGLDVAFAEYVPAAIVWLVFDLLHYSNA